MTVKVYSPVLPSVEVFGAHEGIASATGINQTVSLTFTPTEGTLVVVPYGDTVSQLQLEVGPTPSSYIPTEDAEVTRAADIMTVPAANMPWPEPVVIGDELVTNGTFDTDTGWTKGTGATISGGTLSYAGGGSNTQSYQTLSVSASAGKTYVVTYEVSGRSAGTLTFKFGNTNTEVTTANGSFSHTVVASSTSSLFYIQPNANFDGSIDNISVREINPLAVSIQMEGEMTYADSGVSGEAMFFDWEADSNNRIRSYFDTSSTRAGVVGWLQEASGTLDLLAEDIPGSYSPGFNVPFNIASRHGSTFINGAVDGSALTEDTTPTALPDLSSTDLDIGYDFMGTISEFRVWADDLGDAGIEEASS